MLDVVNLLEMYTMVMSSINTKAITSPGPAADKNVWNELVPSVRKLHHFYEFSFELRIYPLNYKLNIFRETVSSASQLFYSRRCSAKYD